MKRFSTLILTSALLMFCIGSFASSYACAKNPNAIHKSVLATEFIYHHNGPVFKNDNPNQFAIIVTLMVERVYLDWYVPVKIGQVVNKPLVNYRYKGCQRWYSSGNI